MVVRYVLHGRCIMSKLAHVLMALAYYFFYTWIIVLKPLHWEVLHWLLSAEPSSQPWSPFVWTLREPAMSQILHGVENECALWSYVLDV